jgi:RHS repeat-associated protein
MLKRPHELDGLPRLTRQTRYAGGGGLTATLPIDSFEQRHDWNAHGERVAMSMPAPAGSELPLPWTRWLRFGYDAAGNQTSVVRAEGRHAEGAVVVDATFRGEGRPAQRTVFPAAPACSGTTCAGAPIVRHYDYEEGTGLLNEMRVSAGGVTVGGARVAFDGLQIATSQLLGVSGDARFNHWSYDARGRLAGAVYGTTDGTPIDPAPAVPGAARETLSPADFRQASERTPRIGAGERELLAARGVSVEAIDPTGAVLTESAGGHKIESVTAGGIATEIAWEGGAEVRSDGRFRYAFDDFGRLVAMTEIATYTGQRIRRMLYSYDGRDRMVGRRAETAIASSLTNPPSESDWTLEARAAMLEADGLPAEVTFAWDPLSDRLVSLHAAGASVRSGDPYGTLVRQIVHGGMGYDDPLEVTLRTREGAGARLTRLYPVFGEAADGLLDVILNERGELVARNVPNDPYGGGSELSAGGASIDRIAVAAKKNGEGEVTEVEVTLRATDALAGPTLAAGLRLAAVDGQGRLVRSSSAAPQLFENDANSARFVLTEAAWNALVSTEPEAVGGEERIAAAISVAATKHLRAAAWAAELPIAAAPEWATVTRPLYTSPDLPIEVRESLSSLASFLAGIPAQGERSTTLYEVEGLALLASAEPNPAIAQLGIATFQAYPFTEPANGKVYARARWYDPQTGTFMSQDPMGYRDSSNLYAFCGGDPINCRDPRGLAGDRELDLILRKIQGAANAATRLAAKNHGVSPEFATKSGLFGGEIHKLTQQLLMDPKSSFYHPRILTEVEVTERGIVKNFGAKGWASSGSLVKDIVVLREGMDSRTVRKGLSSAKDVTHLVVDLKTGLYGAPLRQTETLRRFGVTNLVLRPFGDIVVQRQQSLRIMKRLNRAGSVLEVPQVAKLLGAGLIMMTAAEAKAAVESGDLDRAAELMSGNFLPAAARMIGDAIEDKAQRFGDRLGISRATNDPLGEADEIARQ